MNLQLIIGGSGMGKSTYIYNDIISRSIENPEKNYIVIVPEQYTMETQKKLVEMHPNHGILNIDVLSFQRLSYKIIEEIGGSLGEMLDDTGKNLIIRKCVDDHRRELKVLGGASSKIDFVPQIKAAISEYMQYDISVERAYEIAGEAANPQLSAKLNDIAVIYESFKKYIDKNYLTTEELFTYVSKRAGESAMLSDCVIALDGFTGFTPVQYRLLAALYCRAEKMMVTVPIDGSEKYNVIDGINNLFYIGKETVAGLYKMAGECHGNIENPVILTDVKKSRFADNEPVYFLGRNLFAANKNIYDSWTDSIVMISAPNPMSEVKFVAGEILRLTRNEGLRYRDIAVIAGNVSDYGNYAGKIFKQNGIPVFVDEKRSLIKHSLVDLIRSAVDVVADNYSYDSMMRFAKNPLLPLEEKDVNLLENYCLATGIRGRNKWQQDFDRRYRNVRAYKVDLQKINATRSLIVDILSPLENGLRKKAATAQDMVDSVKEFLNNIDIEKVLEEESQKAGARQDYALASFYDQLMKKIDGLFEQIKELLRNEEFTCKEFAGLLDAGFLELQIGLIPPGMDYVLVGDMTRTRIDNKKVVFCLGLNDGKVLNITAGKNLIGNNDKAELKKLGVRLSPDDTEKAYTQRLYLYMNMTKPSKRLYLSYAASDWNGQGLIKSHIVAGISKIFPKIGTISLKNDEEKYCGGLDIVEAKVSWKEADFDEVLDKDTARAIYGENIKSSITRIEQFAGCAFAHFVSYGLELMEREEFSVDARDVGSTLHLVMENIFKEIKENNIDFSQLTQEGIASIVGREMENIRQKLDKSAFMDSGRNMELLRRIENIAKKSMTALASQINSGEFIPYLMELPIEVPIGEGVVYRGKIDRVDICETEDKVYVKIIDYKSGDEELNWSKIYYGLKLQLFTYMKMAGKFLGSRFPGKEIVPAAALYYKMQDPVIKVEKEVLTKEEVDAEVMRELKPTGVVMCDEEVISLLDRNVFQYGGKSQVLPVEIDTKSNPPQVKMNQSTLTRAEFDSVMDYVEEKLAHNTYDAVSGNIPINPVKTTKDSSCTYCKYNNICGFDRDIYGDKMRTLPKFGREDVITKITEGRQNVD